MIPTIFLRCIAVLALAATTISLRAVEPEPASAATPEHPDPTPTPVPPDPTSDRPFASWIPGFLPTQLFRIMPGETPKDQRFADEYIDKYEVIGGAVAVPQELSRQLAGVLSQSGAFGSLRENRCKFRPGVALRSGEGSSRIDLLICFACDEIAIVPSGKPIAAIYSFNQSVRDALLAASKDLLPDDSAIQDLPRSRREGVAPPPVVPIPDIEREGPP